MESNGWINDTLTVSVADNFGNRTVDVLRGTTLLHRDHFNPNEAKARKQFVRDYCDKVQAPFDDVSPKFEFEILKQASLPESHALDFKPLPFGKFVESFPSMRPHVIDHVIREGETMNIIAASKKGKSWFAVDMGQSVSLGEDWLGTFPTSIGPVLLLDNELHAETLASRMETIRYARNRDADLLSRSFFIESLRGRSCDLIRMDSYFRQIRREQFKLIILDAFYRVLPHGWSENDNATMTQLYNILDEHAARIGCAFVLIHHASKGEQGEKSVTDVGSGAGSMARATDTHLVIRPHEDDKYSVLDAAVRSFPPMEPRSIYYDHPLWHLSGLEPKLKTRQTAAQAKKEKEDAAAIEAIKKAFPTEKFTTSQIRSEIGGGDGRALNLALAGVKKGVFMKAGKVTNQKKNRVPCFKVIQ